MLVFNFLYASLFAFFYVFSLHLLFYRIRKVCSFPIFSHDFFFSLKGCAGSPQNSFPAAVHIGDHAGGIEKIGRLSGPFTWGESD